VDLWLFSGKNSFALSCKMNPQSKPIVRSVAFVIDISGKKLADDTLGLTDMRPVI
jgi:hypothetical protein